MKRAFLLLLLVVTLTGCHVEPITFSYRGLRRSPKVPLARPEYACDIYADGTTRGTAFPVEEYFAITAAHVVKDADRISVMNYPAYVAYVDEERDVCVLQTDWHFSEFYELASYYESVKEVGDSYEKGDSGTPLFSANGNVVAILTGRRSSGEYVTADVRFLKKLHEDEEIRMEDERFEESSSSDSNSEEEEPNEEAEEQPDIFKLPRVRDYNPD